MPATNEQLVGEVRRIQFITLTWMGVEAVVSLGAAWKADSPALLGFGGDSAVELLSAAVVVWRFSPKAGGEGRERAAGRIAGGLLLLLAGIVALGALLALAGRVEARPSRVGIALLFLAAVVMPWIAKEKRRLAATIGSATLRADAAESAVCGYLAVIALVGLLLNAVWRAGWADPLAAMALLPLIVREGWEALDLE